MIVTLVYVGIGVAGFNSNRAIGDREGSWIAHGVSLVASSAKQAGYKTNIIDMRQLSGWDDFVSKIKSRPSDVYGLSVSPVDYNNAIKAIYHIKLSVPKAKIIVGGIYPSIFPEDFALAQVDSVICGEGEISFVEALKSIEQGEALQKIVRGKKPNLDELPIVDREMWEYGREMHCNFAPYQKTPSITMLAGRGCPYKCTYCQPAENSVFGKPFRIRSAENVVNEMVALHEKYKYKSVTFWDDTFTFSRSWCSDFADRYEKTGIKANIAACSRADIICNNEDMIKRLAEVGVNWFVIGLESGSQRILDLIKKGTTVEQNIRAAEICKKHGIKIFGTYMYGLPTETKEESTATYNMIKKISPEHASPFWFNPIKGTDIYTYCKDNDLIIDNKDSKSIARTGVFDPIIKNVDYEHIKTLMLA